VNDLEWAQRQLVLETKRRIRAERKYSDLLAGIAKAVVLELRAAKYIEIHTQLPESEAHE
jgi:hypothetical protein